MTEFTPLAEAASSAILLLFLGLPTAWRTKGFPQALWRQTKTATRIPLFILAAVLGVLLGIGAWIGRPLAYGGYVMLEMWSTRAAMPLWNGWNGLTSYCDKRRFYQPQHAA